MKVASFELIPTDIIYMMLFLSDPDGGNPINGNFEKIGLEHHLLMNNFGTLGFFIVLSPLLYLIYYIVDQF